VRRYVVVVGWLPGFVYLTHGLRWTVAFYGCPLLLDVRLRLRVTDVGWLLLPTRYAPIYAFHGYIYGYGLPLPVIPFVTYPGLPSLVGPYALTLPLQHTPHTAFVTH